MLIILVNRFIFYVSALQIVSASSLPTQIYTGFPPPNTHTHLKLYI